MTTLAVDPSALAQAALRIGALEERVRATSSAAGRSAVGWRLAALDDQLPGCRTAAAAARAGVALGRAGDSFAAALGALAAALRRAAFDYDAADRAARPSTLRPW
jgi:hypothetical protein